MGVGVWDVSSSQRLYSSPELFLCGIMATTSRRKCWSDFSFPPEPLFVGRYQTIYHVVTPLFSQSSATGDDTIDSYIDLSRKSPKG